MVTNPQDILPGYFWGNNPNVNQELRRRIALQMMTNKNRGYPKNIGEGLTAIGDSLGEIGMARRLMEGDAAQNAANKAAAEKLIGGGDTATPAQPPAPQVQPLAPQDTTFPQASASPIIDKTDAEGLVDPSVKNSLDAAADTDPWAARRRAVAGIESGGARNPYALQGAATRTGDRAYGKYQVMGANVPEWTKAATGTALTPQQFLASAPAQEATFQNKFGQYADKYGDAGAARAWFGGEGGMNNLGATDVHGRLNVGQYGQDYTNRLTAAGGVPAPDPRTAAAQALLAQRTAQAVPQPNPTQSGGPSAPSGSAPDQRLAMAELPPEITGGASAIRPAPALPQPIRQAPPPAQVAQAQGLPPAGYISPALPDVQPPAQVPMTDRELKMRRAASDPNNPELAAMLKDPIAQLEAARIYEQNRRLEQHKIDLKTKADRDALIEGQRATAAHRQQDYDRNKQEFINEGPNARSPSPENMAKLNTPQSQQRSGIPTTPPVPVGITPKEWAEKQAPEMVKAVGAYEKATPQFDDALKLLRLAREHPGREWGVGSLSGIASKIPGSAAFGFSKIMEQIGGKNFLQAYQILRGGGPITEIEGTKAEAAQARLSTAQNKADFDAALNDFEIALRKDLETVQRKVNRPVTAWRTGEDNASYAPDIGTRRGNMEYIGGNPATRSSWRPAE